MKAKRVPLHDVLVLDRNGVSVAVGETYRMAGLRSFGKGLFERPLAAGDTTSYRTIYRLATDQVVYSRLFAWEGAIGVVPPAFDGWHVSPEFPTFTIDQDRVVPGFVAAYIKWPQFHDDLARVARGLGQRRKRVHVVDFLGLAIPLPPMDEQRRIADEVARVGHATAAIQSRLSLRDGKEYSALLPNFVDAVISSAATTARRVGELAEFVSDIVHPGDDPAPARCFVGLQHIEPHTGRLLGSDPLTSLKGRKFRFQPGDVLYGYLRPYLNKVWVADRHGLCSVDQYVLRPLLGMSADLLAHALRSKTVLDRVNDITHNLVLPRLRSGLLDSIELCLPPEHEAGSLLDRLNAVRDLSLTLSERRRRQSRLAQGLLPAALNEVYGNLR